MQLPTPFNAREHDPTQGAGGQLPIGKHAVIIESSEVKPTRANDGGYLQLNLKITEGPMAGTTGAYRLNLFNANSQTVDIANKQMSAVCHVTGVFNVTDSAQLHDIPFMIEVAPQKKNPEYTEVKKVFDAAGNEPGKAGQTPAQAPAGAPAQPQAWGGAQANAPAPAQEQAPAQAQQPWGQPAGGAPAQAPQNPAPGNAPAGGNPVPWGAPQG